MSIMIMTDLDDRPVIERLEACYMELAEIADCAEDDCEPDDLVARIVSAHDDIKEIVFQMNNRQFSVSH